MVASSPSPAPITHTTTRKDATDKRRNRAPEWEVEAAEDGEADEGTVALGEGESEDEIDGNRHNPQFKPELEVVIVGELRVNPLWTGDGVVDGVERADAEAEDG